MISLFIYFLALFFELIFFIGFSIFTLFLIYSTIKGSPYVPTNVKQAKLILEQAKLKKNQIFLELGCGDGRVVREAVKKYQVKGIGVEINPLLLLWAKFLSYFQKISIDFLRLDIVKNDLPQADIIYIFLMPKLIQKIKPKLLSQIKKKTLVISHGFKVIGFEKYLYDKIDSSTFPTYFYKL